MKKLLILPAAVMLLAAGCGKTTVSQNNLTPTPTRIATNVTSTPGASATPVPTSSGPKTYTQADVAKANSASNCLTIIEGKVYNLTDWINQHPGGPEAILSICGKDGTAAFLSQHGHAQRQEDILKGFYVGDLKN